MTATVAFETDDAYECYLACHCTDCNGRAWPTIDDAKAHVLGITGPAELVLVNVGWN